MRNVNFSMPETTLEVVEKKPAPFRVLATGLSALLLSGHALAAPIVTLEGSTSEVRLESQDNLKISVIDWSAEEDRKAVFDAFSNLQDSSDEEAFTRVLNDRDTRGYIFTAEATGYSVKYAAENPDGTYSLLVTPGLKTRNRYMWEPAAPDDAPAYTLLEVKWNDDVAEVRTSLAGGISLTQDGLRLSEGDYPVFGEMADATPYYLKGS